MKAFTIPTIFSAVDKVSGTVRRMSGTVSSYFGSMSSQVLGFVSAAALAATILGGLTFSGRAIIDYENAVQSFRTIVSDLNDSDFSKFEKKISEVAFATKKSTIDVAKAFEMIAGLNAKFAETPGSIAMVTKAAITLSKASKDDLGKSASNLTGILNQFNLGAESSDRVINVLAAGAAVGASSIIQTADAFTVFGAVAKDSNLSLEESTALVNVLAKNQIFAAEAGTALRGTMIRLKDSGLGYKSGLFNIRDALIEVNEKLGKLKTSKEKDAFISNTFGTINATTGTILRNNIELFDQFTKGVTGTSEATKAAEINSNTLSNRLQELKNTWISIITSTDQTTQSLSTAKTIVVSLTNNLESIVSIATKAVIVFLAWKTVLLASRVAWAFWNISLGISNALQKKAVVYTAAQTLAMKTQGFVTRALTASTWSLNAALAANPVGLVIVGVLTLVAAIALIINKWNEWGAAISLFIPGLGLVISTIQSFRRNWDMVVKAFKDGGIIAGIVAIHKVLFDALLQPMQQIYQLLHKITGVEMFRNAALGIQKAREQLGVNTKKDENGEVLPTISTRAAEREVAREAATSFNKTYSSKLVIVDESGRARMDNDNPMISMMPEAGSTYKKGWSVQAN